jgi:hypothetical protein
MNSGSVIALSSTGRHAWPWWGEDGIGTEYAFVRTWGVTPGDAMDTLLPLNFVNEPSVCWFPDGHWLVADYFEYNGPLVICENGARTNFFDANYRNPNCLRMTNGVLVIGSEQYAPSLTLDIAYRQDGKSWWTNTFLCTNTFSEITACNVNPILGFDGLAWVFVEQDASGNIKLLRLAETGTNTVRVVDYDATYFCGDCSSNGVGRDGVMQPHGELPAMAVQRDVENHRLVLCYNSVGYNSWCGGLFGQPVIVGVQSLTNRYPIALCFEFQERLRAARIFVKSNTVSYALMESTPDCQPHPWTLRTWDYRSNLSATLPINPLNGGVCSDGQHWSLSGAWEQLPIYQPVLGPDLKWVDSNYNLTISTNLSTWSLVVGSAATVSGMQRFYRLQRR